MPLILGANSLTGGYEVDNSLRFNSGSSDNLNRTPATTTNRKTATLSFWIKKSKTIAENDELFSFGLFSSASTRLYFRDGADLNKLALDNYNGTSFTLGFSTNQLFRDYSAWYHIVLAIDTTQATNTNRLKLYVNGEQVTSFASINYGSLNEDLSFNNTSSVNYIGRNHQPKYFDGYMSEVNFIDGQQLTPTDFGEFDEDSGIWKPIAYTGTYGTNGFYLEFKDSSALGDDTSGNGNDFTVNNLTSIDQTTDTPTNNFCTMNPLHLVGSVAVTFSNGNCTTSSPTTGGTSPVSSIEVPKTGKWYCEIKVDSTTGTIADNSRIGIAVPLASNPSNPTYGARYVSNGQKSIDTVGSAYGATYASGDIIGIAVDSDSNTIEFYKNGVSQGSLSYTQQANETYFFTACEASNTIGINYSYNFGNPSFTISSGNSDENGIGLFEYSVPSGYFSLCTANLAEFG
jgi:hypothetical protein